MDVLQARARDKASEILQENPTLIVAMGRGDTFNTETCYFVGHSDEISCVVKPNPALVEAVREDAQVAFTANKGFPNRMLQGTGRAFFLGGLDQHPHIREQTLAKIPEAAAFLSTIRNLGVLQILPDLLYITDDTNLGFGPRPSYAPAAALSLPSQRGRWLQALCISSWSVPLIPVLVGAAFAQHVASPGNGWLVFLVGIVSLLFHTGGTLMRTSTDFQHRVERKGSFGSSRVLIDRLLPRRHVLWAGMCCIVMGSIVGLFLVMLRGLPLLLLGGLGLAGSFGYAGWPVRWRNDVVSDVAVILLMGPLMLIGSYGVLTGMYPVHALLISLPIGLLATAIFQASRLRVPSADAGVDIRIQATVLGWADPTLTYDVLLGLAYGIGAALLLGGNVPVWGWLAFGSAPLGVWNVVRVWRARLGQVHDLTALDRQTALLHLAFGSLLTIGLLLGLTPN